MITQDRRVALHACDAYRYREVKHIITGLDDLVGGWRAFVPQGGTVLLKPNLLKGAPADHAVSPHPVLVRAVAETCLEAGAGKVIIGDSPGMGSARSVAAKCGILDTAREMGIDVVDFRDSVDVATDKNFLHKKFSIAREAAEADLVINLPKFKTHAMMTITLAVKNIYGVFVGRQKARWHFQCGRNYYNFGRLLVELAYTVKPGLSILDAVVGMEGNGPGSGTPRRFGFIAASRDPVCLDRTAVAIAGLDPADIHVLKAAGDLGLTTSLDDIEIIGDPIERFAVSDLKPAAHMHVEGPAVLRPLAGLVMRFVTTRPRVDTGACRGCRICMDACPAHCISQPREGGPVKVDHTACIRCFCCQELCPEGAITAHDAVGVRLLKALGLE